MTQGFLFDLPGRRVVQGLYVLKEERQKDLHKQRETLFVQNRARICRGRAQGALIPKKDFPRRRQRPDRNSVGSKLGVRGGIFLSAEKREK